MFQGFYNELSNHLKFFIRKYFVFFFSVLLPVYLLLYKILDAHVSGYGIYLLLKLIHEKFSFSKMTGWLPGFQTITPKDQVL